MASAVTTTPERLSILSNCGTAVISLDLSPTATCPSTRRCSAAQAETRCSGEAPAARSKERRRVLPSSATTPGQPSAKWRMNARKQAWNCAGSSSRNTRENVSWLGMPCRSVGTSSRKVGLARPNRTMSVQVSQRAKHYSIKALRDAERAFVAQAEAAYGRFVSAWSERPKAKPPAPKRPGYPDATTEERL